MKININLVIDIYKKTAVIIGILSILSFIIFSLLMNTYKGFSFSIGTFLIFLNVLGIALIGKFSGANQNIEKDKVIISIILFLGKLMLLLIILFLLIYFKLVDEKLLIAGLSLGFFIFFIANLIFLPLQIYKIEKNKGVNYD
jgi:hypothetical protein